MRREDDSERGVNESIRIIGEIFSSVIPLFPFLLPKHIRTTATRRRSKKKEGKQNTLWRPWAGRAKADAVQSQRKYLK